MVNPTNKMIEVYGMLKGGNPVKFETLVSNLACEPVTAMVLICALKRDCGAEIETIRNGRKVEAYQLHNAAAIAKVMVSKTKTKSPKAAKPVKAKKTVVAKIKVKATARKSPVVHAPTLDVQEIDSDAELESLKAELGLSSGSYSE